jgi:surface antigen
VKHSEAIRRWMVAVLLWVPLPALSFNLKFLRDAPASSFTERDWELIRGAVQRALQTAQDGHTISWKNPASGHLGSVTPVRTSQEQSGLCRVLKIHNQSQKASAESYHRFCKQSDGGWKAATE